MALTVELQCLLQTFFSQLALTEVNLRAVIAELSFGGRRDEVSREVINETIQTINRDISDLDYEIRRTIQQSDGKDIWVLCNTTSDQLTQLATIHPQNEISYFKALLNAMFVQNNTLRAETLAVAHMEAIREGHGANLTKAQAEQALKQFVAEAWLQKSFAGYYSLTARSLMELQGYLRETFNDNDDGEGDAIKSCYACKEFLLVGYRCPDLNCSCRLHLKCHDGFFRAIKGSNICPVCREAEWTKESIGHVGERAARQSTHGRGHEDERDCRDSIPDVGR